MGTTLFAFWCYAGMSNFPSMQSSLEANHLRGHAACLQRPVYVRAQGSVRQSPARPGLLRWGCAFLKTCQGGRDVGENIASIEGKITALDGANIRHEEVTTGMRTKLAVVVGPLTTATEMKTHAYVLHSLLGGAIPLVEATPPPCLLDQLEPDGVGAPHGGAGDHGMVRLRRVVDRIAVFERLNLGANRGGGGGTGGVLTGIIPVPH